MTNFSGVIECIPPADWRKFHATHVAELDAELRDHAVRFLRSRLRHWRTGIRKEMAIDPQLWWTKHHFHSGMMVRNLLREKGFGEKEFGVDNLDDYYVGLMELAFG